MKEVFKEIPGYPNYEASTKGQIRVKKGQKIRALHKNRNGYFKVTLSNKGVKSTFEVHKLIAKTFLNHTKTGYKEVVDHKNGVITNNCLENLRIITQRKNTDQKHIKSASKYVGVTKSRSNWMARIYINGERKYLGSFNSEYEAHLAYQSKLRDILK